MINNKYVIGLTTVLALLTLQFGSALAAPVSQATTIDGTVQSVTQSTDSSGKTIFIVAALSTGGNTQTVKLSAADAVSLRLVTDNGGGSFTINNVVGTAVSIPSSMVIANPCSESETGVVAGALAAFFCQGGSTVLDNTVAGLHAEGFGFGEIAQACFMAEALQTTCGDILNAKKSHDFSALGLPSDISNWGKLRKFALVQEVKSLTNLGAIVSGRATSPVMGPTPVPTAAGPQGLSAGNPGQGPGNGQGGNGHGKGNGKGHGHKP